MTALVGVPAPTQIFRIARAPDPWLWPPWAAAGVDGTFGNRWDDVEGNYRVLYAGSSFHGCFVEVLSRFRPAPHVIAGLVAVAGPGNPIPAAVVPKSWFAGRAVGEAAAPAGAYADVGQAQSLTHLQAHLASRLVHHEIRELDGAAIRQAAPRRFTQEVSTYVYKQVNPVGGQPAFAGIKYLSRFGDEFDNWAIFERPGVALTNVRVRPIAPDEPAFLAALATLDLTLEA